MSRSLLWTFLLADVAGVGWCVSVLGREFRQHLTPARHAALPEVITLPDDFVMVPAQLRRTPARAAVLSPTGPGRPASA